MNFNVVSPQTIGELLETIARHQGGNFRFGAGGTDLLLELKKLPDANLTVINLARLNDLSFTGLNAVEGGVRIGALVTAARIASSAELKAAYPVLTEAGGCLASQQIRQVATVGGNLCTASPAGDIACALVALQARCEILNAEGGVRTIPIAEFFTGVRKTALCSDEVLRSILIPANSGQARLYSGFIKVGIRRSMECAVVSLAHHILTDERGITTVAGIAVGSVAPTIRFTASACEWLKGKPLASLTETEAATFAAKVSEYASPISDLRATAEYRSEVLFNISRSLASNHLTAQSQ